VRVHDEPVATATWLSHWVLCRRAAADGFDAIFGGLGGDELNAGEYEYFTPHFADLRAAGRERELAHEIAEWSRHHDHPIFRKDAAVAEANMARLTDPRVRGRCLPDRERITRYASALHPDLRGELEAFEPVMDEPFDSYLRNRCFQDLFRETTPCCLRAEDRHTTALGLRSVDPFLDHRVVELMFAVPGDLKIRDGITKRLLREATVGLLPEETRTRIKKTGWNAPADRWFAGPGRARVLELIESPRFAERGIYDVAEVRRLLDEHDAIVSSGRPAENHMMFFWQLVNLELWLRSL
jgi:asparagine synthase (glutamine-hydrolysing)